MPPDATAILPHAKADILRTVVLSTQPLSRLPTEFGTGLARGRAYAKLLEQCFPLVAPPGLCTVYPDLPAEERVVFCWVGNFPKPDDKTNAIKFLIEHWVLGFFSIFLHYKERPAQVRFFTAHGFSRAAVRAQRQAWRWSRAAWLAGAMAASAACFAGLAALVGGVAMTDAAWLPEPMRQRNAIMFEVSLATFLILVTASWWLVCRAKKLRLPPALRTLEKWPFRLEKIIWPDLR